LLLVAHASVAQGFAPLSGSYRPTESATSGAPLAPPAATSPAYAPFPAYPSTLAYPQAPALPPSAVTPGWAPPLPPEYGFGYPDMGRDNGGPSFSFSPSEPMRDFFGGQRHARYPREYPPLPPAMPYPSAGYPGAMGYAAQPAYGYPQTTAPQQPQPGYSPGYAAPQPAPTDLSRHAEPARATTPAPLPGPGSRYAPLSGTTQRADGNFRPPELKGTP
jgi:hypothetical protein